MKILTSELTDEALDWAVAVAKGALWQPESARPAFFIWPGEPARYSMHAPAYSAGWLHSGSILDQLIEGGFELKKADPGLGIKLIRVEGSEVFWAYGPTAIVATLRCYVALKLGKEVDVPDEFLQSQRTPGVVAAAVERSGQEASPMEASLIEAGGVATARREMPRAG